MADAQISVMQCMNINENYLLKSGFISYSVLWSVHISALLGK
jgi:hypothetical protein